MPRKRKRRRDEGYQAPRDAVEDDFESIYVWERATAEKHPGVRILRDCKLPIPELEGQGCLAKTLIVAKNYTAADGTQRSKLHIFPPTALWEFCDRFLVLG